MKRIFVVRAFSGEAAKEPPFLLEILQACDDPREARIWIEKEAENGKYSILAVMEFELEVGIVQVPTRTVTRGQKVTP